MISLEATPLIVGILGYLIYFSILKSNLQSKIRSQFTPIKSSFYWIQTTRIIAFVCMAIFPIVYIHLLSIDFLGINCVWSSDDSKYTFVLALLLIPLGAINAKGKEHLSMYPQVRMKKWNSIEYAFNILSWGLYLLGYEFLFRGILFLGLIPFTGLYPAILINTLLYALAHLYKGKKETLGSIPLGIVLCLITSHTETIWTAFFVHWIMATNNFVWSHYYTKKNGTKPLV
jgi:membrane protease YdiL (CAAX protease family)